MDRAAIYCRVSTKDQKDRGTSLQTQEQDNRAYCAKRGYEVVWCGSEDATGADMERAKLRELRKLVRAGDVDVVVVWTLDRLSRDQVHQTVLMWEMEEHKARLELAREDFDDTPEGKFLRSVRGFMAEVERAKIALRTSEGIQRRVENGHLLAGGWPRYGYRWDDPGAGKKRRYVVDDEAAEVVRLIFHAVAGGMTLGAVVRLLDARGVLPPSAYQEARGLRNGMAAQVATNWNKPTLRGILHNPAYKGEMEVYRVQVTRELRHDHRTGEKRKVRVLKVRDADDQKRVVLPAEVCPPIVDAALWEVANTRHGHNSASSWRNSKHTRDALLRGGYAKCGYCDTNLFVRYRDGRTDPMSYRTRQEDAHPCREHGLSISAHPFEEEVWADVCRLLANPEVLRTALDDFHQRTADVTEEDESTLGGIEASLVTLAKKRTNLLRLLEDEEDEDTRAELRGRLAQLNVEIGKQRDDREKLAAVLADRAGYARTVDALAEWAEDITSHLPLMDLAAQREVLYLLGAVVRVRREGDGLPEWDGRRWDIEYTFAGLNTLGNCENTPPGGVPLPLPAPPPARRAAVRQK